MSYHLGDIITYSYLHQIGLYKSNIAGSKLTRVKRRESFLLAEFIICFGTLTNVDILVLEHGLTWFNSDFLICLED